MSDLHLRYAGKHVTSTCYVGRIRARRRILRDLAAAARPYDIIINISSWRLAGRGFPVTRAYTACCNGRNDCAFLTPPPPHPPPVRKTHYPERSPGDVYTGSTQQYYTVLGGGPPSPVTMPREITETMGVFSTIVKTLPIVFGNFLFSRAKTANLSLLVR